WTPVHVLSSRAWARVHQTAVRGFTADVGAGKAANYGMVSTGKERPLRWLAPVEPGQGAGAAGGPVRQPRLARRVRAEHGRRVDEPDQGRPQSECRESICQFVSFAQGANSTAKIQRPIWRRRA